MAKNRGKRRNRPGRYHVNPERESRGEKRQFNLSDAWGITTSFDHSSDCVEKRYLISETSPSREKPHALSHYFTYPLTSRFPHRSAETVFKVVSSRHTVGNEPIISGFTPSPQSLAAYGEFLVRKKLHIRHSTARKASVIVDGTPNVLQLHVPHFFANDN